MTFWPRCKHQPQVLWYSEPNGEFVNILIIEFTEALGSPHKKREAVGGRWALWPAAIGPGPDERGPWVDSGVHGDAESSKSACFGTKKVVRKRQDTLGRHGCEVQSMFANESKDLPIVGPPSLDSFMLEYQIKRSIWLLLFLGA